MTLEPVYLHSSWRSSSTYVWAKFRACSENYSYFEPLNEHLSTITQTMIDKFCVSPFFRHPNLDLPYLEEYRPLISNNGGIDGFPAHLSLGHYCVDERTPLPELVAYFKMLGSLAEAMGKRPVYGLVRSDLRVGWFRSFIPGINIFLRRDPRHQFQSMVQQANEGNDYFLRRWPMILKENQQSQFFAPLIAIINGFDYGAMPSISKAFESYTNSFSILKQIYVIFYYTRVLADCFGAAYADYVLDIDNMSNDQNYRRMCEIDLKNLSGSDVSFSDCKIKQYDIKSLWYHDHEEIEHIEGEVQSLLLYSSSVSTITGNETSHCEAVASR